MNKWQIKQIDELNEELDEFYCINIVFWPCYLFL